MLGLAERFGQLPSTIEAEGADLLRLVKIEALGRRDPQADG